MYPATVPITNKSESPLAFPIATRDERRGGLLRGRMPVPYGAYALPFANSLSFAYPAKNDIYPL